MSKNKNSFIEQLKSKYVFSFRKENKFLESIKATLNLYEIFSIFLVLGLSMVLFSYLLFKYTPLKTLLGVDSEHQKQHYFALKKRTDSLEQVIHSNKQYITSIHKIMNGDVVSEQEKKALDSTVIQDIEIAPPSEAELMLRDSVKEREKYSVYQEQDNHIITFTPPLEGLLSDEFNLKEKHFGVDILAKKNSAILATADGVVLYSSWSEKDGHTIILSHENDYISIYKHNDKLLKRIGEQVDAGDAIAIIGNSGSNSSGYHLHFELWQQGIPQNPQDYIKLKS